jgi:alkylation response protein AidB-like acyl-CoA dehydrogenase
MKLLVDERDVKFVLYEQLRVEELCRRPLYAEHSQEMFDMALEQAEKLAEKEFFPANKAGDRQGCRFENGRVKAPEAFHQAYQRYCEGGWLAMSDPPEVGGQGFPVVVTNACVEMFAASNWSLLMYPGLTHGAGRILHLFGRPELQELYLEKMFSGEWGGTMCLTEAGAGSDVGNLRTKATRRPDGAFNISGQKIFISSGMHDLTENNIHMVLARIGGAPKGTKGISIFLVPMLRYDDSGDLVPNDVACGGIEHKMGIHGSATAVLNFGENNDCIGYLLGEENKGMHIMFHMMNEARLFTGMQGLALGSTAYLHALEYSKQRIQGAPVEHMKDADAVRVPIIKHPDVRRMLMFMKSSTEGLRAMLYLAAYCLDRVRTAENDVEREMFQGYLDLLIPICKSRGSDLGFQVCETAIQVYGGYGYTAEYPVEQFLRDCKIASIYEGTNGIQALDLIGRKVAMKRGQLFKSAFKVTDEMLSRIRKDFQLRDLIKIYDEAQESLIQVTKYFALKGMSEDFQVPVLNALPYLNLFGDVVMGFLLIWQAYLANRRLQEIYRDHNAKTDAQQKAVVQKNRSAAFYAGKMASAQFLVNGTLSQASAKARSIMIGDKSALDIPDDGFALV